MKKVTRIDRGALNFVLEASRSSHPREFVGVLRARGDTITEVLLLPGTVSSDQSAVLRLHMLPIDPSVCGTVHSHPVESNQPSQDDAMLFSKFGHVHMIVAYPYTERSWKAYNHRWEEIHLEVRA